MTTKTRFQPIVWTESMATGIDRIDRQHRYLIDTLQKANEKLIDNHDDTLLSELINDLLGYAIMHFETEEKLMQDYGYHKASPDLARTHIDQHRDFSRRVVDIHEQLREGQEVSRVELLTFLNDWLRDHVLGIDRQLGEFLVQVMDEKERSANA